MSIYLDNHSTTAVDPAVVSSMAKYLSLLYGNPGSRTHARGSEARAAVSDARDQVAAFLGARPREITFTSGGTEANNIAILGCARALAEQCRGAPLHAVTQATEHLAVLRVFQQLQKEGWEVTVLPVDASGRVDPGAFLASLTTNTKLASIMWVNNEIGTIQPISEIAGICHERGVVLHCDAVQATATQAISLESTPISMLSISAHKFHGPKGIGALYINRNLKPQPVPISYGGGQERGLRSGTLPVHQIVGLGTAADLIRRSSNTAGMRELRDLLLLELQSYDESVTVNGTMEFRVPNNLNVSFDGIDNEALASSVRGVDFSTGSACTSATIEPSYVVRAIADEERARSAVRLGLSRYTTKEDVLEAARLLGSAVQSLREFLEFD